MTEPEDVQLSTRARAILGAARRDDPPPEVLAALRRKVVPTPRGGGPGGASVAGAALGAAAIGAALFFWWSVDEAPPTPPPVASPDGSEVAATEVTPPSPSVPVMRPEPEELSAPVTEASSEGSSEAPARAPIDEASYVESIRQALERQPARAVRLARRHPSLYPDGLLAEEAGALEAEGLARSGELEAARSRADALYARFPSTPYRRRIERAIEQSRTPE